MRVEQAHAIIAMRVAPVVKAASTSSLRPHTQVSVEQARAIIALADA
jgi:hypothetical protein